MDVCDDNEMPVLTVNELPKTSVDELENVTGSEDCILRVSSMTAESCLLKMLCPSNQEPLFLPQART